MKITSVSDVPTLSQSMLLDVMPGDKRDHRSVVAMRQRHARISRDAQRRRHAGHHFKRNARVGQRFGLFAAAPENKRIAALQPHHVQAAARALDQQLADLFLR